MSWDSSRMGEKGTSRFASLNRYVRGIEWSEVVPKWVRWWLRTHLELAWIPHHRHKAFLFRTDVSRQMKTPSKLLIFMLLQSIVTRLPIEKRNESTTLSTRRSTRWVISTLSFIVSRLLCGRRRSVESLGLLRYSSLDLLTVGNLRFLKSVRQQHILSRRFTLVSKCGWRIMSPGLPKNLRQFDNKSFTILLVA